MKRATGMTLIELIVALAVVSTLLGLALPSFRSIVERQRTASAHNLLLATIQLARTTSIMQRRTTVVCPSQDGVDCSPGGVWEGGWMAFADINLDGALGSGETRVTYESAGADKLRIRTSASRPKVQFRPDGRSAGNNVTIRLCATTGQPLQAIVINNGGRARQASAAEVALLAQCA